MTPLAPIGQVLSAYSTNRAGPAGETGFGTMVADAAQSALSTVRQSEQTTVNAVAGKADVQDVVTGPRRRRGHHADRGRGARQDPRRLQRHHEDVDLMNEGDVIEIVRSGFYASLLAAGPALLGALLTGLVISIMQALTQVQEMTLAYIPKIFVTLLVTMLFLPLSFAALRSYMDQVMQLIVGI